jgi:hypothetical protein
VVKHAVSHKDIPVNPWPWQLGPRLRNRERSLHFEELGDGRGPLPATATAETMMTLGRLPRLPPPAYVHPPKYHDRLLNPENGMERVGI